MAHQRLLRSVDFTRSIGKRAYGDETFNDAVSFGRFPAEQRITKINSIEFFASDNTADAIISGLRVTYAVDGNPISVIHGHETLFTAGNINTAENEVLVGASGRVKVVPRNADKTGRISFIVFSVYDRDTGLTTVSDQFGSNERVGASWGSYGPIIALHGTASRRSGLTSLGFVNLTQGVPGIDVVDN